MREQRLILAAIVALGVTAVVTQLVLMRELLGAFAGNELVLGIVLGNWLFLTGLGTWLGRLAHRLRHPVNFLIGSLVCIGVIPVMQVVAVRTLRDVVFTRGAVVGVLETLLGSGVVLAPFCVLSGFMLTLACAVAAVYDRRTSGEPAAGAHRAPLQDIIAHVYVADTVGSIAGGVVFSFGLMLVLDHCGALLIPAALSLAVAVLLAWRFGHRVMLFVAGSLLVSLAFAGRLDEWTTALQYRGQQVVFRGNSPYGRLVVTESAGQRNFIENGVPLFSTHNTEQIEETVHYAMAQRPDARRVLLVGGGVTGTARELLKYPDVSVTYVELDPLILAVAPVADPRIRVVNADGRRFVQRTPDRFEVVIVDMPGPSTLQLNRFFTAEFFAEVKSVLTPGGVLAFPLGHYANYVGPELARLLAAADATVRQSFSRTLLIPGGRIFVLASDSELTADIAGRLPAGTKWVNRNYLDAQLTSDRLADLRRATAVPGAVNRDFQPVLYLAHLRHWLAMFPMKVAPVAGAVGLVLLVYLVRQRGPALVVLAGGFAASALEIVLLLGFQILYGSAYRQLGVLVTVFMAGLAAGAWWANRPGGPRFGGATAAADARKRVPPLTWLAFSIAGLAVVLPGLMSVGWLIGPLTFGLAVLVGMEFPVACRLTAAEPAVTAPAALQTASRLYTADFVGACVGALLTSTVLVPLVGVAGTCWITAGLNAVAGVMLWWRR